jgi:hypothetical protein
MIGPCHCHCTPNQLPRDRSSHLSCHNYACHVIYTMPPVIFHISAILPCVNLSYCHITHCISTCHPYSPHHPYNTRRHVICIVHVSICDATTSYDPTYMYDHMVAYCWARDMIIFMKVIIHFCCMYIYVLHVLQELFEEFYDKMV